MNFNPLPWNIAALNPQEAPWHLLLAADPSRDNVQRYLRSCAGFGARETTPDSPQGRGALLGICLLMPLPTPTAAETTTTQETMPTSPSPAQWEVMNMAVAPAWQHQGMGTALLQRAIGFAREQGARQVLVGTGSFGDQLLFYQRAGFRVCSIERDHFLQHYTTQLWERGAQHKDRLTLSLDL